jgi:hypothetical protein
MAHDEAALRPETHALDALIKATVERVKNQTDSDKADAMLFMGNWHQAIPSMVIQDPVLEPVDKLVWMVIMLQARETGGRTAFPSYDTLASKANVSSTSTISRAIAILRLTRWLTLCAKVRQKSGQFKGNVYILHDEPLPFLDALHLDGEYMHFIEQSTTHHHARVQTVAKAVLDSLDEDIQVGKDLSRTDSVLERRVQATQSLTRQPEDRSTKNSGKAGRYFSFTESAMVQLRNSSKPNSKLVVDQDQNSKVDEKAHYSSNSCSSKYKNTTTTTATTNTDSDKSHCQEKTKALIYPPRLSDNQKALADRYLTMIDSEDRQFVLDELQGRLESEQRGMKPVYDELRFLHSLCKAAQQGEFVPNLGIKVVEARLERTQPSSSSDEAQKSVETVEEKERSRAYGREQLAMLRQSLGIKKDS